MHHSVNILDPFACGQGLGACGALSSAGLNPKSIPPAQVTTSYLKLSGTTAFAVTDALSIYLYVVNDGAKGLPLAVNAAKWANAAVGGTVIVNQVPPRARGRAQLSPPFPTCRSGSVAVAPVE